MAKFVEVVELVESRSADGAAWSARGAVLNMDFVVKISEALVPEHELRRLKLLVNGQICKCLKILYTSGGHNESMIIADTFQEGFLQAKKLLLG